MTPQLPRPDRLAPPVVLVVDDDVAVHAFLSSFLESKGFTVHTAATVERAIAALDRWPISAVVLDVKMPGRPGLEVLAHIRADPKLSDLPVMILTGAAFSSDEEQTVSSLRAYVFYKQEESLDELAAYLDRVTMPIRLRAAAF